MKNKTAANIKQFKMFNTCQKGEINFTRVSLFGENGGLRS